MAYGSVLVRDGSKTSIFGVEGHHADFAGQNRTMSMAVFNRVLLQDCTFDEEFDLLEDWDFWIQVARKTKFAFAGPDPTCECTGNQSGTWSNDVAAPYIDRLRKKWALQFSIWEGDLRGILEAAQKNIQYAMEPNGTLVRFALRAGTQAEFVLERARDRWLVMNAWSIRGAACELLGNLREAVESYSEALRLNPTSQQFIAALDRVHRQLRQ